MVDNRNMGFVLVAFMLVAWTGRADDINGITMDFVPIGSAGNAVDSTTGYGSVGYDYRIGATEVTRDQFAASGLGGGSGDSPEADMAWHIAAQYANWLTSGDVLLGAYTIFAGKVTAINRAYRNGNGQLYALPTEDEWYKAAYFTGSGYSDYANGTSLLPVAGTDANYEDTVGTPWAVGDGALEQNDTFNMMGNVLEWLETSVGGDSTVDGSDMVLRGGAYNLPGNRLFRGYRIDGIGEDTLTNNQSDMSVGMRIVSIPEPGTISLMSLSTICLFFTRTLRRRKLLGKSLLPVDREHLCDTYCTREEWDATYSEVDIPDGLVIAAQLIQAKVLDVWVKIYAAYKIGDQKFWNYMVVSHECRTARKKAFRSTLKRKALSGFDAFLAVIMK